MSSYKIEAIRLGTQESGSSYWTDNVNDTTIAIIAEKLGLKVNTITSNSEWILYKGDDAYNTTGFKFIRDSNSSLRIVNIVNGKSQSGSYSSLESVALGRSYTTNAYTAKLLYIKVKGGVVFGVQNIGEGATIQRLRMMVMSGHDVRTNDESVVYIVCPPGTSDISYLNTDINASLKEPSEGSAPEDLIVMWPYIHGYIKVDDTYAIAYGKGASSNPYSFMLNNKNYLIPYSYSDPGRLVFELPDEE